MKKHPLDGYDFFAEVPRGTPLLVADYRGRAWRLSKRGVRYHGDVFTLLHGAKPARPPAAYAASERMRARIDSVQSRGTDDAPANCPPVESTWWDDVPGSYARRPYLEIRGEYLRAVRPVYDDVPRIAWMRASQKELASIAKDIKIAPSGMHLQRVQIRERTVRIEATDPRAALAATVEGARPMYEGGPIEVPVTAWRAVTGGAS